MSCRLSANNGAAFQGSFEVSKLNVANFLGSFTVAKAGSPGVPGFSLTPAIGGSIGFSPYAAVSGVSVTDKLDVSFKSAYLNDVTNLLLESNSFSTGTSWSTSASAPTLAKNQTGPYGISNNAWTIEDTDALSVESISQIVAGLKPNTSHVFSIFVKEGATTPGSLVSFQAASTDNFSIEWSSGAPVLTGPSASLVLPVKNIGSGWYRVAFILDSATLGANTSVTITISPAHTATFFVGSILIYGAQLEEGVQPNGWPALDTYITSLTPGYVGHTTSTTLTEDGTPSNAAITWEVEPGDGGSRGAIEWMKVRLAYEPDSPVDVALTSYDAREVEFYPYVITPESGQFYRTIVASDRSAPGFSEFSYRFDDLKVGKYQLLCEAKQTFNPTPYVIVSGFTVGTVPHTIAASGVPSSGENPLSVNLFSTRTDSTSDPTKYIHWDLGTERLYGDNTSFYRNPTHVFDRQGYYNPVVTHITTSGFVISQALPSGFAL